MHKTPTSTPAVTAPEEITETTVKKPRTEGCSSTSETYRASGEISNIITAVTVLALAALRRSKKQQE